MKETFYERIGEAVCRERLTNGLEVCVVPKPGYAKKYAFFSTRYGGMDTRFCLDGQWLNTPAGIAHYLEHKMFDTREGNALQELAKNGAEPNAFTAAPCSQNSQLRVSVRPAGSFGRKKPNFSAR